MLSVSKNLASLSTRVAQRQFSSAASAALPDLEYDYAALEPVISKEIMEIHHKKHHQTYVNNFNAALDTYSNLEAKGDVAAMVALQPAIKFNGGGHVNHDLFWRNLAPKSEGGGEITDGPLLKAIENKWGTVDLFKSEFNAKTAAIQGSGWGWLALDANNKNELKIVTCANQDPCSTTGTIPIIGVDVWEHAYYLQYQNLRPKYLEAVWDVVNFNEAERRFLEGCK